MGDHRTERVCAHLSGDQAPIELYGVDALYRA